MLVGGWWVSQRRSAAVCSLTVERCLSSLQYLGVRFVQFLGPVQDVPFLLASVVPGNGRAQEP